MLSHERLREMAGTVTFERGQACAARITSLTITDRTITAWVRGAQAYEVRLWLRGKKLQFCCTCPFAAEGAFCKHCVAVCLRLTEAESTA